MLLQPMINDSPNVGPSFVIMPWWTQEWLEENAYKEGLKNTPIKGRIGKLMLKIHDLLIEFLTMRLC